MTALSRVYELDRRSRRENADAEHLENTRLFDSAVVRRLAPGETLHMEGDPALFCYQLVSGVIKEYNTLEDGRRQIADFCGEGDFFAISESATHLHTAEAISESVVRCFPRDAFLRACTAAGAPRVFLGSLIASLHRARERMIMLGRMSASQRVAAFLLRRAEGAEAADDIALPMSRQDIADHLGLTIETVCRSLTELKKKSLIEMRSARRFSITDERALSETARGVSKLA